LQPGLSVAKVALEHGINANLLRKWIDFYRESGHSDPNRSLALPAFAPVLSMSAEKPVLPILSVTLPNGVKLKLPPVALSDLPLILNALAELPCSASNRD
jgi:transposase